MVRDKLLMGDIPFMDIVQSNSDLEETVEDSF